MEAYQERVIAEREELFEKFDKLRTFCRMELFTGLPYQEWGRLTRQLMVMTTYLDILNERIDAFEKPHAS